MSKPAFLASGQGIAVGAASVAALVAGGLYLGGVFQTPPAPKDVPAVDQTVPAALPATPPDATVEPAKDAVAEELVAETPALPDAPRIDVFRLDTDGTMLIAGSTAPGWLTEIMLDGQAISPVDADGAGQFVQFVTLPASDLPRILSLRMRDPDAGTVLVGAEEVIIAPTPAPIELALAETTSDEDSGTTDESSPPAELAPQTQPASAAGETAPSLPTATQATPDVDPVQSVPEAPSDL